MSDKINREQKFMSEVDTLMENIRTVCKCKVLADQGQNEFDPNFDLANFKVTKRQVADSLDSLPVSLRSSMVAYCQGFFNAIHEA